MVYKKYVKRGGKLCGPYYYESYRGEDGKVHSRYLKDYKPKKDHKKLFFVFGILFGIFILLLAGNINYSLTGNVVSEVSEGDLEIAGKIAEKKLVSSEDIREHVDLNVKQGIFEKNKVMEFDLPGGKLNLEFDLLDYGYWVESDVESEVSADNFDILVEESSEKYKWGYDVRLNDLNFMARIDVSSDGGIVVIDNQTLKIGSSYLSFSDLVEEGYVLSIDKPVVLGMINITELNVSEMNVSEMNVSEIVFNDTIIVNETLEIDTGENITSIVNESLIDVVENITAPSGVPSDTINGTSEGKEINITLPEENATEEIEINETAPSGVLSEESKIEVVEEELVVEDVEQLIEEEESDELQDVADVTGNIIRGLTGFIINGVRGITGFAVQEENIVSIYIQRDFTNSSYEVGDMINLDPFIIILISKAEHLDSERNFVSDIYDYVREKDGNWSEVIGDGEYVRVTFEENLTSEKDITLFARSGGVAQIEVYRKDGTEVVALFENISEENWYKVYLTVLGEGVSEDVFDLKVFGSVEFDYIVDPVGDNGTATDGRTVFRCGTITEAGVFVMNQSITNNSLTGDCINITVANVELNCGGFYISSDDAVSGVYSDQLNTTIRNCNVSMSTSSGGYGIELNSANNSYVYNNTLNGQDVGLILNNTYNTIIEKNNLNLNDASINAYGFWSVSSSNNTLINNIADFNDMGYRFDDSDNNTLTNNTASFNDYRDILLSSSSNNILTNNTARFVYWQGIALSSNSDNNTLTNNNIWNCTGDYACILITNSDNNLVSGGILNLSTSDLIRLASDSNNNIFKDIQLIDATTYNISLETNSDNNTFVNISYSGESVSAGSELIRKWYYQAYVNDTSGNAVSGADVLGYNVSGSLDFNATTNSSGWINKTEVIEYVNSGGTKSYYSLYSVNARNSSYADGIVSTNISGNLLNDTITMSEVAGCGWLTSSGSYSQSQNIIDNGLLHDCINITTQNITFDGSGFYISSDDAVSGIYSNQLNTTIRNCNVSMGARVGLTDGGRGIDFVGANNSYVYNNTLNGQGYGLFLTGVYNTEIKNNTILLNEEFGISLSSSLNNLIQNNIANSCLGNNPFGILCRGISLSSNSNNNQIINNTINSNTEIGVFLSSSSNNTLTNNTANLNEYGIYLFSSLNNTLTNNNVSSNTNIGIYLESSSNNILTNNTANSNKYGIYLYWYSQNNTLTNNNLWNCTTTTNGCLYFSNADNNTISGEVINFSASNLIYLAINSDNNKFSDIQLIGATTQDVNLTDNSINNTFLNCSYNISKEYVETGSELIRKWYYQAYVNDTSGNDFVDANVTGFNSTGGYVFNLTANASGWTSIGEIIEYVNYGGTKSYYSNYTIYARNASLSTDYHTYNVSLELNNLADSFEIDNIDPVVALRDIPSSTSSTTIDYNYNVTDASNISSCSLILGGVAVASDAVVNNSGGNETISYTTPAGTHTYYISCTDSALNVGNSSSGTIVVISTTTTVATSSGGGGTSIRTISLKIEFPSDFSEEPGKIEVPITIYNNGQTNLRGVSLTGHILKDFEMSNVRTEFNQSSFDSISAGEKKDVVLTAYTDLKDIFLYELVVNVSSTTPAYNTDNGLILNLAGANATVVQKMLVFTEDMIVGNAECLELKEMVDDARKSFEQGDFEGAILKSRTAVEACKEYISGVQQPIYAEKPKLDFSIYLIIGIVVAVLFGIIFNLVKVVVFRKKSGKRKV